MQSGDAAEEPAATDGDEKRIELRILLLEFEADGSLTEQSFELIVGVNGHGAGLRGPGFAGGEGIGVALAADDEARATSADALDFFRGSDVGYKNLGGPPQLAGGIGEPGSVGSPGCRRGARLGGLASGKLGKSAAGLVRGA